MRALITATEVGSLSRPCYADEAILVALIQEAEREDIKPRIGDALYLALKDGAEASLSDKYKLLLNGGSWTDKSGSTRYLDGLKTALAYFVYARVVRDGNITSTRYGSRIKSDDNSLEAETEERQRQYRQAFSSADALLVDCLALINEYPEDYNIVTSASLKSNRTKFKVVGSECPHQDGRRSSNPTIIAGKEGASAYEIAVSHGYRGTEAEWLVSLHGADGESLYDILKNEGYFSGSYSEFVTYMTTSFNSLSTLESSTRATLTQATSVVASTLEAKRLAEVATNSVREKEASVESAEALRVIAERARVSAETSRASAENERTTAESARSTAESGRSSAEQTRVNNENARMANETARQSAEQTRQSTFESGEQTRSNTFSASESSRANTFTTSESSRATTFSTNEAARQATFDSKESARDSATAIITQEATKLTNLESAVDKFETDYGFLVANNQYFDKTSGVYGEVAIGSAGNIVVQTGNKSNIVFVSEINGKTGDTFYYATIGTSVDSLASAHRCFVYNDSLIDENGGIVNGTTSLQRGNAAATTSTPLGGYITLTQDAKYFAFVVTAKNTTAYPQLMEAVKNSLVMAKSNTIPTEYVSFGKVFIPYKDWKGSIIEDCIIKDFANKDVYYSEEVALTLNSMASDWTGNVTDGFNRVGGVISGEIILNGNFTNGAKYVVILDATDGGMNFNNPSDKGIPFFVRIGTMLPTDVYNGALHSEVVIKADNSGQLHLYGDDSKRWTQNLKIKVYAVSATPTEHSISLNLQNLIGSDYDGFGKWNTSYGYMAMHGDFNGTRCVAIGYKALLGQYYGMQNIAIGTFALSTLYRGEHNIAIGSDAIYQTIKADDNIVIGKGAVAPISSYVGLGEAYKNVVIGHEALPSVSEWVTGNVIIGDRSGQNATNYNVIIGASAHLSEKASRSIAIGHNATATKSNQMVLGSNEITEVVVMGNKKLIFNADGSVTWETI